MKVGFTGARFGMTAKQKERVMGLLSELYVTEFHHGDCVGADAEAHRMANMFNCKIVIHPPNNDIKRAFCGSDYIMQKKDYLTRNQNIVNDTDVLIATPREYIEQTRSGTWYTIRYGRRKGKKVYIIQPDGKIIT